MFAVSGFAMLGVTLAEGVLTAVDVRFLGLVALADLIGRGVRGERVGIAAVGVGPVASEETAEAAAAVPGGVVVGGRGAETLFFLAVATKAEFSQSRDDEKDTTLGKSKAVSKCCGRKMGLLDSE